MTAQPIAAALNRQLPESHLDGATEIFRCQILTVKPPRSEMLLDDGINLFPPGALQGSFQIDDTSSRCGKEIAGQDDFLNAPASSVGDADVSPHHARRRGTG